MVMGQSNESHHRALSHPTLLLQTHPPFVDEANAKSNRDRILFPWGFRVRL